MPINLKPALYGVKGVVYCLTNRLNGKRYVGITTKTLLRRVVNHRYADSAISRALKKYGLQNFDIEILGRSDDIAALRAQEIKWINDLGCMQPRGYNLTAGGEGINGASADVRRKISISKIGKRRPDVRAEDLTNKRFGRLIVIAQVGMKPPRWLCHCDCGKEHQATAAALKAGKIKSCGCLRREITSRRTRRYSDVVTKCNPAYSAWQSLRYDTRDVDQRWRESFVIFATEIGDRPDGGVVCRRDRDKGFNKSNCFWGTRKDHAISRPSTVLLEADGRILCKKRWMQELGINQRKIDNGRKLYPTFQEFVEAIRANRA